MANVSSSNSQKALVPKLRFPGFEGDYISTHIGDVFSERAERGGATMELLSVTMNDGVVKRSQIEGKDNSSEDKSNYKIVRSGDLVYNSMRMWQGANGISKYDGIVSPAYTVLKAVEEIDEGYFAALFKTVKLINEFRKNSQGLTSDTWNLKYPQIAGIRICIPKIDEQHKISSFLQFLDKRIDAQRRLVDVLKSYKRGALSKLFPKKGASVPEYRFAGFSGDWEERKLGDEATEMIAGGDVDKSLLCEEGNYPVIANALTGDGIIGYYKEQYRIKAPAVTVTGRGDVGHAKARNIDFTPVVRLLSIKSNHNPLFLENAINTLQIVIESTGVPQLTVPQLAKYELMFPKTAEEEMQIGNFFASLDNLITLHQQKVSITEKIKIGLLQGLFI